MNASLHFTLGRTYSVFSEEKLDLATWLLFVSSQLVLASSLLCGTAPAVQYL